MNLKESARTKIEKILEDILELDGRIVTSVIVEKQYNFEVTLQSKSTNLKIQVFFGKKGVKTIIQGNKDSSLHKKIEELVLGEMKLSFAKDKIVEPVEYIGSDESGKGDFFGPLVTAAVYVDKNIKSELENLGVRDSKEISDLQINNLAKRIKTLFPRKFSIVVINPSKYNQIYDKFKNLNKLLNWSHSKAIENLVKDIHCKNVVVDKFSNKELNISYSEVGNEINFIYTPKAERFTAVAAASILARNKLNLWFWQQKKNGIDLPKGASGQVEDMAVKIIKQRGTEFLAGIAKLHFKTMKKISL